MTTETQRQNIKALYLKGWSYKDIAKEVQCTLNQVSHVLQNFTKRCIHLQKQGENHNVAKLSHDQVFEIVARYGKGETPGDICGSYGISKEYVVELVKAPRNGEPEKFIKLRQEVKVRRPGRPV